MRTFSTLILLAMLATTCPSHANDAAPAYQRSRFQDSRYYQQERTGGDFDHGPQPYQHYRHYRHTRRFAPQQPISGFQFQRPYPYHLDYYRMRYGGGYEPYFGNLYGPPQVQVNAPVYGGY